MCRPSSVSSTNNYPFHYYRSESNGFFKGPRRVLCFCILGILTPTILMSIPLLMRFVFYGVATYHLNPSDMRLLEDKISTTWCEVKSPEPMSIRKTLIVPDDHKEYWGFYLLKGSTFSISTCARFKGGTLLVVKGRQHLEHCAYIGNEDSNGDSDEFSNSRSGEKILFDNVISEKPNTLSGAAGGGRHTVTTVRRPNLNPFIPPTSSEEMSNILSKIRTFIKTRPKGYKKLRKVLVNWMLVDSNRSTEINNDNNVRETNDKPAVINSTGDDVSFVLNNENINTTSTRGSFSEPAVHKIRHAKSLFGHGHASSKGIENSEFGIIRKRRHTSEAAEVRRMSDSGENGAFEEDVREGQVSLTNNTSTTRNSMEIYKVGPLHKQSTNSIWVKQHSLHTGILNSTNHNDGSNSESESSFSSSEEALAKCEGIVGSFNLKPMEQCGTYHNDSLIPLVFNATVNISGYYYFIFGSENEKRDNFIEALFELKKYEYVLDEPFENCTSVRECDIDFDFASEQKLVVSIPQPLPNRDEIWDEFYIAETECKPRTIIYLIFVLTVPLMILLCAFQ